jgi:hypothetical protein
VAARAEGAAEKAPANRPNSTAIATHTRAPAFPALFGKRSSAASAALAHTCLLSIIPSSLLLQTTTNPTAPREPARDVRVFDVTKFTKCYMGVFLLYFQRILPIRSFFHASGWPASLLFSFQNQRFRTHVTFCEKCYMGEKFQYHYIADKGFRKGVLLKKVKI